MKSVFLERLGETIFALYENDKIIELKINRFHQNVKVGQEYIARIKTIDLRISSAFVDLGMEQAILPFNAPRPKYIVEGALLIVKITSPKFLGKLAVSKYIGDASTKYQNPELLKDAAEWGNWPIPQAATQDEMNEILIAIENAQNPIIGLKNGGTLAIETTRAMTTIDIDAGIRKSGGSNQNNFNHKLNIEAANEIIKQIRLRNISGLIIIDFVGKPSKFEAKELNEILQNELPKSGKIEILPISKFGLCEIARARNGTSINDIINANPQETLVINALNSLCSRLRSAKGDVVKLVLSINSYQFLQIWNFDWKNYINEKIGGLYTINPANIEGFEIS
ncbi:MAG: ribonuclease E/G [Caulobacterales bacterium]|nr:ribonuclease E/G [Caulobacterales bacterium]